MKYACVRISHFRVVTRARIAYQIQIVRPFFAPSETGEALRRRPWYQRSGCEWLRSSRGHTRRAHARDRVGSPDWVASVT